MDKKEIIEIIRKIFMDNSKIIEWGEYIGDAIMTKEQCDRMFEQIANKLKNK